MYINTDTLQTNIQTHTQINIHTVIDLNKCTYKQTDGYQGGSICKLFGIFTSLHVTEGYWADIKSCET